MKAVCAAALRLRLKTNPLESRKVPTPQAKTGVLVRVRACGVCRTDLQC